MIHTNFSLQAYNTFGLPAIASRLVKIEEVAQLQTFLSENKAPYFILGGGSNMLLTKDIKKTVLKNEIQGIEITRRFKNCVYVAIGGGVNWHELVLWTIKKKLGGIENLSLIPGTVGASPIQNIGAYGVELKDVFYKLQAVNLRTGKVKYFFKKDCQFGYRESVFKKELKGEYFITKVWLKLNKANGHKLNMKYGAIQNTLQEMRIKKKPTIKNISDAIIAIRSSKLPDPAKLGNSGSFFKNPEISKNKFNKLQKQFPNIVFYDLPNGKVKVPAGWLIEQCGWKGKRIGNTGAHAKQALVLVNYGNATGQEVKALAFKIIASVKDKFGIKLSAEVNII